MAYQTTVYRVLISTPSDVLQELKAIPEVISLWNAANAPGGQVFYEAVHWRTHSYPAGGGRPQAILNEQIVLTADLLVAVFWTRLGSPTGTHESGTVEEIDELLKAGKPVLLYFSNQPVVPSSVDMEQYQKVKDFQKAIRDKVLYAEYESVAEFRELLGQHLTHVAKRCFSSTNKLPGLPEPTGEDQTIERLRVFADHLDALYRRYSVDWQAEKQSQPVNTDEAKWMMRQLVDELVQSRSQITSDETGDLTTTIDRAIIAGKKIRDHMMFMDGGRSYAEFWALGEEMLGSLRSAVELLRAEVAKHND
jgi:hypothetical protein